MKFRSVFRLVLALVLMVLETGGAISNSMFVREDSGKNTVIVFVHGILGDATGTWLNGDSYWPEMLRDDEEFNSANIFVYEYPTSISATMSIDELAEHMRLLMDVKGVARHENLVFLMHSMGGLVTRAYLLKNREIAKKTRLAYFFSTPTAGSEIASLGRMLSSNPQVGKMVPMRSADYLGDLLRQWLNAGFAIPSYCAYETKDTFGIRIVTQASALHLCTKRPDPIPTNHLEVVKPANRDALPYLVFLSAFTEVMQSVMSPPSENHRRSANSKMLSCSTNLYLQDYLKCKSGY